MKITHKGELFAVMIIKDRQLEWFAVKDFAGFIKYLKFNIKGFKIIHTIFEKDDEVKIQICSYPYFLICKKGLFNNKSEAELLLTKSDNILFVIYFSKRIIKEEENITVTFYTKKENFLKQIKIQCFSTTSPDLKIKNLEYDKLSTFYSMFTKDTHNDYLKIFVS